jgi:gliding motility-associated-like protein
MKSVKKNILCAFFCLSSVITFAQLVTNNIKTPEELVSDVLAGEGVQIFNVTFTGNARQRGEFSGGNIGLNNGIILSTGTVLDEQTIGGMKLGPVGPNNNPGGTSISYSPIIRDQDLADLAGRPLTQTFDVAFVEFDFIPEGDSINFRYVFASEEYPDTFVSAKAFDVFGFFISGPGFTGKQNIAVLDDGLTEVSINTINTTTNSNLYISNGKGFENTPQFTDPTVVNFNGFSKILVAKAKVVPCETYRLKIAICDISDDKFDTGVFLEANSLKSKPKYSLEQPTSSNSNSIDNQLIAGCKSNKLTVKRSENINQLLNIPFSTEGDAVLGVDYTLSNNNSVILNPGATEQNLTITPLNHPGLTSPKKVILVFDNPFICAVEKFIKFEYEILPFPTLNTLPKIVDINCPNEEVTIQANVQGGISPLVYSWVNNSSNTNQITVNPVSNTIYNYTVSDACGQSSNGTVEVQVSAYSPLNVSGNTTPLVRCKGDSVSLIPTVTGGGGEYEFLWSFGSTDSVVRYPVTKNETVFVTVKDKCNFTVNRNFSLNIDYPIFSVDGGSDQSVCVGDQITLEANASGGRKGSGDYKYFWNGIPGKTRSFSVNQNSSFVVEALDSCGIVAVKDTVFVEVNQPTANFDVFASAFEIGERIDFVNRSSMDVVNIVWYSNDGQTDFRENTSFSYNNDGFYSVTQTVTDQNGCKDSLTKQFEITFPLFYFFPNSFTPDGDQVNDIYIGKGTGVFRFNMIVFDRWGNEIFVSNDENIGWDGNFASGNPAPQGVYIVRYYISGSSSRVLEGVVPVTLYR